VYDVTPYLRYHPAGVDEIMRGAGDDATLLFQEYHAWVNVTAMLKPCIVGPLEPTPAPRLFECTLEYGGSLSPDCHWIRLRGPGLAEAATAMHAPWHVKLRVASEQPNRELERPYTPLAMFAHSNDCLELVVKAYSRKRAVSWLLTHSGVEPRSALVQLRQAASPWRDKYSKLGMVCNGTGVLPLLQVLREAFERGVARVCKPHAGSRVMAYRVGRPNAKDERARDSRRFLRWWRGVARRRRVARRAFQPGHD